MEAKNNAIVNVGSLLVGFVAYMFDYIRELLVIVVVSITIDYFLGIISAIYKNKKFDKEKGIWGFIRKTLYMVVIVGGFTIDYLIYWLSNKIGFSLDLRGLFVIATSVYLIGTEWLSILSHLNTLKIPIPKFLTNAFIKVSEESQKITIKK